MNTDTYPGGICTRCVRGEHHRCDVFLCGCLHGADADPDQLTIDDLGADA